MHIFIYLIWHIAATSALNTDIILRQTHLQNAGWVKGTQVEGDAKISLTLALTQLDHDRATKHLLEVSDPKSPSYGRYWSASDVSAAFLVPNENSIRVLQWISDAGIGQTQVTRTGNDIHISCTARDAEALLSTNFHYYRHPTGQKALVAYDSYALPRTVDKDLDWVLPSFTSFPSTLVRPLPSLDASRTPDVKKSLIRRTRLLSESGCANKTTLSCISQLYHVPLDNGPLHPNNSFGIFVPGWSTWIPEDLDGFFDQFFPKLKGGRPIVAPINGGYRQMDIQSDAFNLEPNMDMEYAMALTYPQPVVDIQVGDRAHPGNLNTMLAAFDSEYSSALDETNDPIEGLDHIDSGKLNPPKVLSISYVWSELQFPPEYLARQCVEFLKLGLQGTTVIVSSGDAGPASHPEGNCIDATTGTPNATSGKFVPAWPAACPWITVVGGTTINSVGKEGEDANDDYPVAFRNLPSLGGSQSIQATESTYARKLNGQWRSSGGGFSDIFAMPAYQASAVTEYLTHEDERISHFKDRFNARGRAYPDVSAVATAVQVVTDGETRSVYGTSSSAPIFASIISRINSRRLQIGKGPVGFINPVLYDHPEALNDVVTGHNSGCGLFKAFRAAKGWDAVTGLGTPHYEKLLDVFLNLP